MADIIQIRRDTAANWASVDPILALGEMGYETDTNLFKFGDAISVYTALPFAPGGIAVNPFPAYTESTIDPIPALELDIATFTIFKKTISIDSNITFTSPLSNGTTSFTLQLTVIGTAMPIFPASVTRWIGGEGPPDIDSDSVNEYVFVADDPAGTTYVGYYVGEIA